MIDVIALHRDDLGALCRRFHVRRLDQTLLVSVESMQASMSSRDNGGRVHILVPADSERLGENLLRPHFLPTRRREALSRFVTDARLEADNNIAENAMRGIALGRKNYLFAGSDAGGQRAALMYTIVQTAKLNGMNPEAYLRDTLAKVAEGHPISRIGELMPWHLQR